MKIEKSKDQSWLMLQISEIEALKIIKSLSSQLLSKNSDTNRIEFFNKQCEGCEYFSIKVDFENKV